MAKGFGRRCLALSDAPVVIGERSMKPETKSAPTTTVTSPRPAVIAVRKSCDATGTGLSHFVLMDKEAGR